MAEAPKSEVKDPKPDAKDAEKDASDLGVPMLAGDPSEPVGPEDALGVGPKRGDYTGRIGPANYHPHEAVRAEDGTVVQQAQRPRAEDIGEEAGVKGGTKPAEA
jgi:hypothetical protein